MIKSHGLIDSITE